MAETTKQTLLLRRSCKFE